MIRESKMTIKQVASNLCYITCETRDGNAKWRKQGVIPVLGTLDQVRAERVANQTKWGWTLYDIEDAETLIFWKEV